MCLLVVSVRTCALGDPPLQAYGQAAECCQALLSAAVCQLLQPAWCMGLLLLLLVCLLRDRLLVMRDTLQVVPSTAPCARDCCCRKLPRCSCCLDMCV
jgi:hypothetical protein